MDLLEVIEFIDVIKGLISLSPVRKIYGDIISSLVLVLLFVFPSSMSPLYMVFVCGRYFALFYILVFIVC